jgi:uncharacterized protein
LAVIQSMHGVQQAFPASWAPPEPPDQQRIWVLLSNRVGDNAQVLALAAALNVPYEIRLFSNRRGAIAANLLMGSRLPFLVRGRAACLTPPWPDLVIAAGSQSEPLCAQIRDHAASSGHRVKFVFLGRPWKSLAMYELIVTTPQYRVPAADNVMQIDLPLHLVTRDKVARLADIWSARMSHLPRPYVMVCLGGNINRYTLDRYAAKRLARQANALASGGSLLVCSSFRTPKRIMETLKRYISRPSYMFDWENSTAENPYLAFLGLADRIIVTGDSITMLAEACETRKPVHIFDLGEGLFSMREPHVRPATREIDWLWLMSILRASYKDAEVRLIRKLLPRRLQRDTHAIHQQLVKHGLAAWLGDRQLAQEVSTSLKSTLDVANRVLTLLGDRNSGIKWGHKQAS